MPDRILIVERDPTDRAVWRYGLADEGRAASRRRPPAPPRPQAGRGRTGSAPTWLEEALAAVDEREVQGARRDTPGAG